MADKTTQDQFGVRYSNGLEDWNTTSWWGSIETPEQRQSFTEQYNIRMTTMGGPELPLVFLRRTVTISYSDAETVVDPEPEVKEEDSWMPTP